MYAVNYLHIYLQLPDKLITTYNYLYVNTDTLHKLHPLNTFDISGAEHKKKRVLDIQCKGPWT